MSADSIREISVEEFAQRYAADSSATGQESQLPQLVDVREPGELELAQLDGFINLPLSQFAEWSGQIQNHLDPARETIVMCHHGMRSAQMCYWLASQGFTNVQNLAGGIAAYSQRVDASVPQY
ncbi:rhodanese-like domain-containing protein [Leptolyngbya sp. FACHB-261]|uniref:rhodanese-like domain-containing protein n=1 Tax=Leptolyngbya sp. FACHB-261 TaxID=2692806 RepID=UPI0016885D2F|nr:rhodanese-like domain-containing protein [Leptolyngbya sp. FACHB-261]MBD2103146.1 rhodanese-related sulfurtransferase [Leptolyngbya sp. FACHB-261]